MTTSDPEGSPGKKVFEPIWLAAGRTFVQCRLFEDALLFLVASIAEHENPTKGKSFTDSWDFHSSKTVGQLARSLGKVVAVPENFETLVQEGVKARNAFIHGFFRDVDWSLLNEEGRANAVEGLRKAARYIGDRRRVVMEAGEQVMLATRKKVAKAKRDSGST
jgi:hypothetical protein